MGFVLIGIAFILLKVYEVGWVANWSWLVVLAPFGCAIAWWSWADSTGYYKRREMEKMEDKKRQRRIRNLEALGMDPKGRLMKGKK